MKILIYDIELFSSGVRYPLKDACEDLGHRADMFDWTYYFNGFNNPTLVNRVKDRLFSKFYIDQINIDLQRIIKNGKYDLFLVLMGKYIYPETIKLATENIKYVVNWNTDDPMNMLNSTKWLIDSLPLYHAHFTPRIHLKNEYEKFGVKQLFELDWYYRYGIKPIEVHNRHYEYEGNFIGSWSKRRAEFVNCLAKDNINIFGWGWKKKNYISKLDVGKLHKPVDIAEMMKIFSTSKININLLTIENRDTSNLRNFEIPAANGFQLAERSERLLNLFEEEKNIAFFSSPDELKDKYNFYIKNDKERIRIASEGFRFIMDNSHSLNDRIKRIIKIVDKEIK